MNTVENKVVGFFENSDQRRVLCFDCTAEWEAHNGAIYDNNINPYSQDCHNCGKVIFDGPTNVILFEKPVDKPYTVSVSFSDRWVYTYSEAQLKNHPVSSAYSTWDSATPRQKAALAAEYDHNLCDRKNLFSHRTDRRVHDSDTVDNSSTEPITPEEIEHLILKRGLILERVIDVTIKASGLVGVGIISLGDALKGYCYGRSDRRGL